MSQTNYISKPEINIPQRTSNLSDQVDKRIRIRCRPGQENIIYGDPSLPTNPMNILHQTNGIIFPFTPNIHVKQNPAWSNQSLTHSLQDYYYFRTITSTEINISGKFTAQNNYEGRYLLAVLHFLRSYSKIYFGTSENENRRGLPPPVLLLDGYGSYIFNSLPIIILDWNFEFPSEVDYVKVVLDQQVVSENYNITNKSQIFQQKPVNLISLNKDETTIRNSQNTTTSVNKGIENLLNFKNERNISSNEEKIRQISERIENFAKSETTKNINYLNLKENNIFNTNISNMIRNPSETISRNISSSNFGYAYLPSITTISITCVVQRPPTTLKREFNLQDFREGRLILRKGFI